MRVDTNPFFSRASEYIEMDDKFIKLFSPEILKIFKEFNIWGMPVKIFRSSPGGGKTTLLKIFTAKILLNIKERSKHDEHNNEIYDLLKNLGVYNEKGDPSVAGSLLSFNNEYVSLEFLDLNDTQKIRFFVSLLNTRITLSILQSIALVKKLKFPEDLSKVKIKFDKSSVIPNSIRNLSTGLEFYEWACFLEEKICKEIDSISDVNTEFLEGSTNLFALDIFAPANVTVDSEIVVEKILVMLDDVHNLTSTQRSYLIKSVIDKRPPINTWISERLKALTMDEILSEGSTEERDSTTIQLENLWRKRYAAFEKFAKSVANRRVASIFEDRDDFSTFLSLKFDNSDLEKVKSALIIVQGRVKETYGNNARYKEWIQTKEDFQGDVYDQLVSWRSLEILLYRDRNKTQKTIEFETDALKDEELEDQEGNDLLNAAMLFLNKEFDIPYYYGISNVSKLASFNIEQFLMLAGHLFENILTSSVRKIVHPNTPLEIAPHEQEDIIKRTINKKKWNELNYKIPNFTEVRKFLDAVGAFSRSETFVPNAWNSPGINGIAILMSDRKLLKDNALHDKNHVYHKLAKCIATCIAYNLLDFKLNYRCQNKDLMLLYINRIYCVKYNLPMNNGRFKQRNLITLLSWFNKGFQPKAQKELDI
jgi:hypothetical protein